MLLTIEKLIYGGDGLARLPEDSSSEAAGSRRGKAVFVPFVLVGEKIEAAISEQKPSFARAHAEKILAPSPHRVEPQCPYFSRCGGCHYQHASYEHQLEIKQHILRENLQRIAKLDLSSEIKLHASPPWNYRNRSRLQVQTQPQFATGYFRHASHELLAVEQCPISSPLINRGIAALWQIGRAQNAASGVREIEFFTNAEDTNMLATLWCEPAARRAEVRNFAELLKTALPEISGVVSFREPQSTAKKNRAPKKFLPKSADEKFFALGDSSLTYNAGGHSYRVSAGSFFQTNRHLGAELLEVVTQGQPGEFALDLYAGVGLFSVTLATIFGRVISVESSEHAVADLQHNLPAHAKAVGDSTEDYLSRNIAHGIRPDLVVVDPPRSGLGDRVPKLLASLSSSRITYVSCDPATLARDLVSFLAAGYRVEQAHLFDLFPQTFHIETVLQLVR